VAVESERAFTAVWNALRGDATLTALLPAGANGVHRQVAPVGTARPFLVLDVLSAVDAPQAIGGARLWQDTLLLTKACGAGLGAWLVLRQIQDRIDALLQGLTVTVDGVLCVKFRRESAPPLEPENVGGVLFVQTAQVWRTEAEPAP
jgi:hypothetical protein